MKREKQTVNPTLKAEAFKVGQVAVATGTITKVKDLETKHGAKTVIELEDESEGVKKDLFLNTYSMNNLIDAFGDDDKLWIGKTVRVVCQKEENYDSPMLVVEQI